MATIPLKTTDASEFKTAKGVVVEWPNLGNGDSGEVFLGMDLADKTVQVKGTFGTGGTVVIEDDQDIVLTDPQDNALSFTSKGTKVIMENPVKLNPRVTAGDGTTSITVIISATRPKG